MISKVSWQRVKVEESENFLEEIWWTSDTNLAKTSFHQNAKYIQTKERQLQAKEVINFTKHKIDLKILPILVLKRTGHLDDVLTPAELIA